MLLLLTKLIEIGSEPLVTDAVVQSAEMRASTIEAAREYSFCLKFF